MDLAEVPMAESASYGDSADGTRSRSAPASRVGLERFGKPSVALARCSAAEGGPASDQSSYEPLFRGASDVLANYRRLLAVSVIVPEELAKITGDKRGDKPKAAGTPKPPKPAEVKK